MLTKHILLAGALVSAVQAAYFNTTSSSATSSATASATATIPAGLPATSAFSFPVNSVVDGVANFGFDLALDDYDFSYSFANISSSAIELIPGSAEVSFTSEGDVTTGFTSGSFTKSGFFLTLAGAPSTPISKLSFHYKAYSSSSSASQSFDFWLPVLDSKRAETKYVKYTVVIVADSNGGSGSVTPHIVTADITASTSFSGSSSTTATTSATTKASSY